MELSSDIEDYLGVTSDDSVFIISSDSEDDPTWSDDSGDNDEDEDGEGDDSDGLDLTHLEGVVGKAPRSPEIALLQDLIRRQDLLSQEQEQLAREQHILAKSQVLFLASFHLHQYLNLSYFSTSFCINGFRSVRSGCRKSRGGSKIQRMKRMMKNS